MSEEAKAKIKYACDILTGEEDAMRAEFEEAIKPIAELRLRIAAGLEPPERVASFFGIRWDYDDKPGRIIYSIDDRGWT